MPSSLPDRAVVRDRIVFRLHRPEPVAAVGTGAEDAAQVEIRLDALLLHVVEALVIGLPDVEHGALRSAARRRVEDAAARSTMSSPFWSRQMLAPIGSSGASATWNGPSTVLSDAPDGLRLLIASTSIETPSDVGQQDELLPPFVAHLAGPRQEHGSPANHSSCVGSISLTASCSLRVIDLHHLLQPLVLGVLVAAGDDLDGILLGEEALFMRCP